MGLAHSLDLLRDTYNYNHWVYSMLRPHIRGRVLEVGSGPGNLSQFLLSCDEVIFLEPELAWVPYLQRLAERHRNTRAVQGRVEDLPSRDIPGGSFDTVLCVNVLEHIRDDLDGLLRMGSVLKPGGVLLLYVPACPCAYGSLDKGLGHFRRYSRRELVLLSRRAGFAVKSSRYVNFVGLLGWWWTSRVKRESLIDPSVARLMDRMVPFVSAVERLIPPRVGQSLFVVMDRL